MVAQQQQQNAFNNDRGGWRFLSITLSLLILKRKLRKNHTLAMERTNVCGTRKRVVHHIIIIIIVEMIYFQRQ
jgi:hypothetical protein